MSEEKQIEEMEEVIDRSGMVESARRSRIIANDLYREGYRKQSEAEWTYGENNTMKCTLCRRRMPKIILARFCPNCGAKMKGV